MRKLSASILLLVALGASGQDSEQPFYLSLDTPPAPELSPAEALEGFTIAPGFEVELVAAEPLVEDPIAITWDAAGNLYVVEMRGFMPDAYGNGEDQPVGMVVRLRDTTGDGELDLREVLLDGLVLPRAIAIVNEGLLVAEPPKLWLCPSKLADWQSIDCSRKQPVGTYGDQPGSVEHVENGLLPGLDNWLYNAKSSRRLKLADGDLLEEATLFRGQWGITQDNDGRLFYNTNSNLLLGDSYDAQPVVAAHMGAVPGLNARVSQNDQVFAARINPGVNRAYVPGVLREDGRLNRPTSASGMTVYRGDQFGSAFTNHVFVTEPAANAVVQLKLHQEGLTQHTEHVLYPDEVWQQIEFFTSTDERFRPVNISSGPDGALYVVDMYRGIIQDHVFLTEELRNQALERGLDEPVGMGRIWRIRATASPLRTTVSAPSQASQLVDWLGHANGWHRDTSQRLLIGSTDPQVTELLQAALNNSSVAQKIHAIWTLSGRGEFSEKLAQRTLTDTSHRVRLAALRAAQASLPTRSILGLTADNDAVVRHHAIMYLADRQTGADEAQAQEINQFLLSLLPQMGDDAYTRTALQAALRGEEIPFVRSAIANTAWSETQEAAAPLFAHLASQAVRVSPQAATEILDVVRESQAQQGDVTGWLQSALLEGVYAVTRDPEFDRFMLSTEHALFGVTDEYLWPALSKARLAYTWPGDDLAASAKPLTPQQKGLRKLGADYYAARCATCHGADGLGIATLAPTLVDAEWVTGPAERLARIVLHGLRGPIEVGGQNWDGIMPGHIAMADFDNEVAAGLLTHLRRSWGHAGRAVDAAFIATVKSQESARTELWTAAELNDLVVNTHYVEFAGKYGNAASPLVFFHDGTHLNVKSAIFNGPMIEEKEDHFLYEPRELRLEFIWSAEQKVTGIRMATDSGGVMLPRLPD